MTKAIIAAITFTVLANACLADSYVPPDPFRSTYRLSSARVEISAERIADQVDLHYTLSVFHHDVLVAKYPNIGFDRLFASADGEFFVGVSNSGPTGSAFVVFDARGNLIRELKHAHAPAGFHTFMSVTLIRGWYSEKDIRVEFRVADGRLRGLSVSRGYGATYDLLAPNFVKRWSSPDTGPDTIA